MHEATFRPIVSPESGESTSSISPPTTGSARAVSNGGPSPSSATPAFGLGLNMPVQSALLAAPEAGSGSLTPGAPGPRSRLRPTAGQALHMDLAGISALGDAASHASMIMQSRQAKLQRWRPNSATNVVGVTDPSLVDESCANHAQPRGEGLLPPAFNRSTTTGTPAMLAGPRSDRQAQWGLNRADATGSAVSSPGEDLPPIPSSMRSLGRVATVAEELVSADGLSRPKRSSPVLSSNVGPSRFAASPLMGGVGMEKQASSSGVGGIEWIDWYDCYKRYKEEKIRADAAEAARSSKHPSPIKETSGASFPIPTVPEARPSPIAEDGVHEKLKDVDRRNSIEASSAIALTPVTSRDDMTIGSSLHNPLRRRSLSIRSTMTTGDPRFSPSQRRASIFDRPRQTSGGSTRSNDGPSAAAVKKKKNLVTKMEGWWNAVKSNFVPESQHPPYRPSTLGSGIKPRIPSAPSSRRGSEIPPLLTPQTALLAPMPTRRESGQSVQSLRGAISHAELRPNVGQDERRTRQELHVIPASDSADLAGLTRQSSAELLPPPPIHLPMPRAPSTVDEESSIYTRTSIDSRRRRQPNLRLELEPHVLTRESSQMTRQSSGSHRDSQKGSQHPSRPSEGTSRSSSYNSQPAYGPGLTPGVPKWEQTPSPIVAVNLDGREARENRPVAPGADITIASVRRHVKHRMSAAKAQCDSKLQLAINQITTFVEERRREEPFEPTPPDEQALDYFDGISDSPLVDMDDSEAEPGDALSQDGSRSRNGELHHSQSWCVWLTQQSVHLAWSE
jgi:serine/threonine-protein kinase RIM15